MQASKSELRRIYRAARKALSPEEKRLIDAAIAKKLLRSECYRAAACVFCYVSTPEEIDTFPILRQALADGRTLCVPLCGAKGEMTARLIRSLEELKSGAYGILEPSADAPVVAPKEVSLAVVPALACDRRGYRLGYGGGYYDRFLAKASAAGTAVLCAECRLADALPREPFDLPCHYIITERQVLRPHEE